jgi:oxygen-dependent protoporphyrinogen oxidase
MAVAVVGGGPAGCAAAHRLRSAGREVVLFERARELGGRTVSFRDRGAVIDTGAGFFTDFYPVLTGLLPRLGLTGEVVALSRSNVLVHGGRAVDFTLGSPTSFATFPFVSATAKARMAFFAARAAILHRRLDLAEPSSLAALDDRSVRDEALATVGAEAYEFLVRPGIEPFWYFSCAEVSRALFLALLARAATARFFTLRSGIDTLSKALVHDVEVRSGVPVAEIVRDGRAVRVDGERFEAVVVATTASVATRLLEGTELDDELRRFAGSQTYVPNVHVAFRLPSTAVGPSAIFPCGPGSGPVAALSFNRSKGQRDRAHPGPPGDHLSVFLTAAASRELLPEGEERIAATAWQAARAFLSSVPSLPSLPSTAEPIFVRARAEAIPVHGVGRYRAAARARARQVPPIALAGDYLATATIDGALGSGLAAAEILLRQ